jgi:two-component system, chemotaxis family, sensor kinase CheA
MDDELLGEFINEAREHLATIETDLLAIEEAGEDIDEDLVNKVFRAAHSIKGASGFFGLNTVKELAHRAETVLDMLRSRTMAPNPEITNVLLAAFDRLRELINNPADSEQADIADLVVSLMGLASSYLPADEKASLATEVALRPADGAFSVVLPAVDVDRARSRRRFVYAADYDLIHDVEQQGKNVLQVFRDIETAGEILDCSIPFAEAGSLDGEIGKTLPMRLVFSTVLAPDLIDSVFELPAGRVHPLPLPPAATPARTATPPLQAPPSQPAAVAPALPIVPVAEEPPTPKTPRAAAASMAPSPSGGEDTLRVNVGLLETLMNLTGELVLSRNQLRTAVASHDVRSLAAADQRLNQVTAELQDAVMRTRLQPIGNVFSKFPRVVRDTAAKLGKDIQLDIRGKDVALDRSLIEGLSDPLTHMVRNAVDHGIESPEERTRAGKPQTGTVRIEARHEAGQVVVEIADDGKGIDPKRVSDAALSKGLITADKLQGMSEEDRLGLIFLPGLSTAATVSDISGRGVGMDVVKTNLDRLGGKVEIRSQRGKGSTFLIKLPLTLAIIPSLILSVEDERFAIPQINVEELLRIKPEDVKRRIEVVGNAEVLLLRDRIIPLVRFDRLLGQVPTCVDPATGRRDVSRRTHLADRRSPHQDLEHVAPPAPEGQPPRSDGRRQHPAGALEIVVVTTGSMQYGLVVSAFHSTEEIVVKPLGRHLKGLREYAGATILGDGAVALIVDVGGLAAKAELAPLSGSARAVERAEQAERERLEDTKSLLLFHNGPDQLCALPLDSVVRLERISRGQVESAGGRRTMQYRGASLPLVMLADTARMPALDTGGDLAVVVSRVFGREVGLLGEMPIDVVDTKAGIDQNTHRQPGIVGSLIINGRTTLVADIFELIDGVHPEWRAHHTDIQSGSDGAAARVVLLAEDSDFFRSQVTKFLQEDGYTVLAAPDGQAAWELLLEHVDEVDVVVTDIEMPRLTGLGLAERIRAERRSAHLPIIALTSLASEEDVARGREAGINDYQVKLDRDRLTASLHAILAGVQAPRDTQSSASL